MGLDTTHNAWHGAYSFFGKWRNKMAELGGYKLANVDGRSDTPLIDWGHVTTANLMGKWEETPKDILMVLIAHSDCDGEITSEHAAPLAERLAGLIVLLPEDDTDYYRHNTERFIRGLRCAASAGEAVGFH